MGSAAPISTAARMVKQFAAVNRQQKSNDLLQVQINGAPPPLPPPLQWRQKLSSVRIISDASLATSVPISPMADANVGLRQGAGASFTPSPVMATTWPLAWRAFNQPQLLLGGNAGKDCRIFGRHFSGLRRPGRLRSLPERAGAWSSWLRCIMGGNGAGRHPMVSPVTIFT